MRRISLVLAVFIVLVTLPVAAEPVKNDRGVREPREPIVRIIKKMFGVRTNSDGLMPPRP
jgi:hypothetical protein